jgi:hypothetical protein
MMKKKLSLRAVVVLVAGELKEPEVTGLLLFVDGLAK